MKHNLYTLSEIREWYNTNTNFTLSINLLKHIINIGIINRFPNNHFSLNEINDLFLQKNDCSFIKNNEDKFIVKENRKILLEKYTQNDNIEETKFKLTKLEGNKLKLSKK